MPARILRSRHGSCFLREGIKAAQFICVAEQYRWWKFRSVYPSDEHVAFQMKVYFDKCPPDPLPFAEGDVEKYWEPSYLGWGKGCWEAGHTAAVEAGSWAVWGKERPAAKGTEVTQCSLQEGGQLASDCSWQITLLRSYIMTINFLTTLIRSK